MRLGKVLLAAALTLTLALGASARADSLGLESLETTADGSLTGDIQTATLFTFSGGVGPGPNTLLSDGSTGIFTSIPVGSTINATALDLSAATLITLTYSGYTFVADTLLSDTSGVDDRTLRLSGFINGPSFTNLYTTFTLSFTQDNGPGNAISFSGTLATVPEPSSVAMLAVGGVGLGLAALRRRVRSRA